MDVFIIEIIDADNVHMELLKSFQKRKITEPKRWNAHCLSYLMLDRILRDFYNIENREISFIEKKPVLKSGEKHFSISHSKDFIALAFSDSPCGVDIEEIKPREFEKISKRMNFNCSSLDEFYQEWTKYEAGGKCLGHWNYSEGKNLNQEFESLSFKTYKFENYMLAVSSSNPNENVEIYAQSGQIIPNP
jgi:phosphopantetheinyl transferase